MLERLKRRLSLTEADKDGLLLDLLEAAEDWVKGYTGRTACPATLSAVVVELAAASYHHLGAEGESSHSEGGVSQNIDSLPARLKGVLDMYRLGRVGD